ncbi:MAG: GntR family transcriptional regulator, partial [Verrucomicrobiota bacterium]
DLLLPFREQPFRVRKGQMAVVYVTVDAVSNRIVATGRTKRFLDKTTPHYQTGEAVELIIRERTPLGYMAIVNQEHNGLLHESRISRPLQIGETFSGYVAAMKPGGKIDLSLEPVGYGRVTDLSGRILEMLEKRGGRIEIGDKSSPEEIRRVFQTSKKSFKQALGALYRKQLIVIEEGGIALVNQSK